MDQREGERRGSNLPDDIPFSEDIYPATTEKLKPVNLESEVAPSIDQRWYGREGVVDVFFEL